MKILSLKPIKMCEDVMQNLESKGLIIRLLPSKKEHRLQVQPGEGKGGYLYKSDINYGAHSLVNVAIDNSKFLSFATHPDNEEIFLLGGVDEKKLYLLISLLSPIQLEQKLNTQTLLQSDFICLDCVFNDPKLSFFVMLKNVPHGECSIGNGFPSTFYCTESSDLPLNKINLYCNYDLKIKI